MEDAVTDPSDSTPATGPASLIALRQAARLGPFFTLRVGDPVAREQGWQTFAVLKAGPAYELLAHRLERTAAHLKTDQLRPVTSLLHLGAAAAICSPLLATAALAGLVPDVDQGELLWRYTAGSIELSLSSVPGSLTGRLPALADYVIDVALDRLLAPFTAALAGIHPLPAPTLAGNVLSALATAALHIEPPEAGRRARVLVDLIARLHPPLREAGQLDWRAAGGQAYFRRRNCCLFYQLPGGGLCGDCVLSG